MLCMYLEVLKMKSRLLQLRFCLGIITISLMLCQCEIIQTAYILEPGEEFELIEDVLVRSGKALLLEELLDDVELEQSVKIMKLEESDPDKADEDEDEIDVVSEYRLSSSEEGVGQTGGEIIYQTVSEMELDEPVVVLQASEDKLKVHNDKRVFVVLRQNSVFSQSSYYVTFGYLRLSTNLKTLCSMTYLKEEICFEWEFWDGNRVDMINPQKVFGWSVCFTSFFTTCRVASSKKKGTTIDWPPSSGEAKEETLLFKTPNEYYIDQDSTYEIFLDLDNHRGECQNIRKVIQEKTVNINGFTTGVNVDPSLIGMMKDIHDNYADRKLGKKGGLLKDSHIYDFLRQIIINHDGYIVRIAEIHGKLRKLVLERMPVEDYDKMKSNPEKMKTLTEGDAQAKKLVEDLSELEEKLKEIDEKGRQIEKEIRSLKGQVITSDIFINPGWKLQEFAKGIEGIFQPDSLKRKDSGIFYGFGTCQHVDIPDITQKINWREISSKINETVQMAHLEFYLTHLRLQCIPEAKEYLVFLLDAGYLRLVNGFFDLPLKFNVAEKTKLSLAEYRMISASLEFAIFTLTYVQSLADNGTIILQSHPPSHMKNWNVKGKFVLPSLKNLSPSINFLLHFAMLYVKVARADVDAHFLKMCRNLVITMRGVMTRLIQDEEILYRLCQPATSCDHEFKNNYEDRLAINALIKWLLHGLSPIEMNRNVLTYEIFSQFYRDNLQSIEMGLKYYDL